MRFNRKEEKSAMTIMENRIDMQDGGRDRGESMVSIRNLTKVFQTRHGEVTALKDVSAEVRRGEVLVLLGPSGCGKTTLLRCIAGLEFPTAGLVEVHGRTVYCSEQGIALPPNKRNLAMVFQSYALWPHMTLAENVAYPLKVSGTPKEEIAERVNAVLATCGLGHLAGNFPGQLSGGQQQRVALARALVANDGLILFDEPLSNLDAKVRERLRDELTEMQQQFGFTAIYVTHDQVEAAALADRIAVMEVGRAAQIGDPQSIFNEPMTPYVADFVGCSNELEGTVTAIGTGSQVECTTPIGTICGPGVDGDLRVGEPVKIMFRPEHTRLVDPGATGQNVFRATIDRSIFLGSHVENIMHVADHRLSARSMKGAMLGGGEAAVLRIDPSVIRIFRDGRARD